MTAREKEEGGGNKFKEYNSVTLSGLETEGKIFGNTRRLSEQLLESQSAT